MYKMEHVQRLRVVPVHHTVMTTQPMANAFNKDVVVARKNHTVFSIMKIPENVWNKRVVMAPLHKTKKAMMYVRKIKKLFIIASKKHPQAEGVFVVYRKPPARPAVSFLGSLTYFLTSSKSASTTPSSSDFGVSAPAPAPISAPAP